MNWNVTTSVCPTGTSDFFGLNYYGAGLVYPMEQDLFPADYGKDSDVGGEPDPEWLG